MVLEMLQNKIPERSLAGVGKTHFANQPKDSSHEVRAGYQVLQDPDAYQLAGLRIWNVVTKSPMTLCSVHVNLQ